ncbi:FadR/GntR family transcriptional regulator [Tahibacter harae]|uniref:FadR family transcriptional regulator n=1 Tax=Tahibacter harae TaxID=2963937 RepID=A0ABT1QT86_9GAMM|nr:FadR/GntR family transcriptional regulator [Tahibacter harae]MCQ4165503.1 FadR family transcriptional regulator [Tahibacter harae]
MTDRRDGKNLTHGIVQDLGTAIVTGVYSDKRPFPTESELCEQYQVSRPVLREAVKMLTSKGLLAARPRRGTWVQSEAQWNLLDPDILGWILERKFSTRLLQEFTQVRAAIEPAAAALAAQVTEPAQLRPITLALERMRAAERGKDDPLESDIAFHVAILQATNNRFYAQFTDLIATALRFSIRATNRYKGVRQASIPDHKAVADAIIAQRPQAAAKAMSALIQEVLDLTAAAQTRPAAPRTKAPAKPAAARSAARSAPRNKR